MGGEVRSIEPRNFINGPDIGLL